MLKFMHRMWWRLVLAGAIIRYWHDLGTAVYALKGGYDDPYYGTCDDERYWGFEVLAEESYYGQS